jgi:hypothetical protein
MTKSLSLDAIHHREKSMPRRARPGHERVAADAMRPSATFAAARRSRLSYSPRQTAQSSSFPVHSCLRVLLPLFASSLPTPERGGLAERPETSSLEVVAQYRATPRLRGMGPPAQPGGTPHGAPPWRCRPKSRLRPVAGSGAKAPRHQPLWLAAGRAFRVRGLPAAVDATSRSAFRIASRKRPSRAGCSRFIPYPKRSQ